MRLQSFRLFSVQQKSNWLTNSILKEMGRYDMAKKAQPPGLGESLKVLYLDEAYTKVNPM